MNFVYEVTVHNLGARGVHEEKPIWSTRAIGRNQASQVAQKLARCYRNEGAQVYGSPGHGYVVESPDGDKLINVTLVRVLD